MGLHWRHNEGYHQDEVPPALRVTSVRGMSTVKNIILINSVKSDV